MSVRVCTDSVLYFEEVFASVQRASEQIEVEMYIFDLDQLGLRFLDHLVAAASRGVRVRILLDGVGSYSWTQSQIEKYKNLGLAIQFYHPVSFKYLHHLNRRNHRKIILIDRKILFSGSLNVSDDVLGWHETGVVLQNTHLEWILKSFNWLWSGSPLRHVPSPNSTQVRTTLTRKMRKNSYKSFREQIRHSKNRLWFVTPYLNLRIEFIFLLFKAVRRKVDVRFLLPEKSDVVLSKYLNQAFYAVLLSGGVRVFEYTPKFLHSKVSIIDSRAWVGSSNLNQRSFIHDIELDFLLSDSENIQILTSRLLYDLQSSTEVTPDTLRRFGFFGRVLSRIVYWFRNYF